MQIILLHFFLGFIIFAVFYYAIAFSLIGPTGWAKKLKEGKNTQHEEAVVFWWGILLSIPLTYFCMQIIDFAFLKR
ncbi:Uncharacterised protein [uncultured archaeon]|nr:Uncharacterised protein [uncultured archaeon]